VSRFLRVRCVLRGRELTAVTVVALAAASCGAPLVKLPQGQGTAAADGREVLADATRACSAVSTITAEIGVTGSVGGRRLRTRLTAGLAAPASARLEAAAPFGAPLFILVATGNDATLLLPHDGRVVEHASPASVLEALAGVPIDAGALRIALIGCPSAANAANARQVADDWRVMADGTNEIYLRREKQSAAWHLVATIYHPQSGPVWRAEYGDYHAGLPHAVRFAGSAPNSFDLRLTLSQVETNVPLDAGVFQLRVPPDADPMTIDELKRARPGFREN
jgi:outer membrane lipoprotein-sorting protein